MGHHHYDQECVLRIVRLTHKCKASNNFGDFEYSWFLYSVRVFLGALQKIAPIKEDSFVLIIHAVAKSTLLLSDFSKNTNATMLCYIFTPSFAIFSTGDDITTITLWRDVWDFVAKPGFWCSYDISIIRVSTLHEHQTSIDWKKAFHVTIEDCWGW